MIYRCPICKKKVKSPDNASAEQAKLFPFCCQRCKMVDLGAWFDAGYKICTPRRSSQDDDLFDESAETEAQ